MPRRRLGDRETTLSREKVRLVDPTPGELASMSRYMTAKATEAGRTKTYRVTWRLGVGGGRTVQLHLQRRYPIAAREDHCVDDMLGRAKRMERERHRRETGTWGDADPDALVADYLRGRACEDVDACVKEDRSDRHIRPRTAYQVKRYLRMFADEAGGMRVRDCEDVPAVDAILCRIAEEHGTASAVHCRSAVSKYCFEPLRRRLVIEHNPCTGRLDLGDTNRGPQRIRHGMSLGEEAREAFVDWLRTQRAHLADIPGWGRYPAAYRQACRAVTLDVALAQATCGFRIGELRRLDCSQVTVDGIEVTVHITEEKSKTHTPRDVPVWDRECAAMLARRVDGRDGSLPVFPVACHTDRAGAYWDDGDMAKQQRRLYDQAAEALGDDRFHHAAGHNWRATLATNLKAAGLSTEMVSAMLGHDGSTDEASYTDHTDTALLRQRVRELLCAGGDLAEVIPFQPAAAREGEGGASA